MLNAASVSALIVATILNLNATQPESFTPVVALKPTVDARPVCIITARLYRGTMPDVEIGESSQLATPSMRVPAGEKIDYLVGGSRPDADANWYSQGDYYGVHAQGTVIPIDDRFAEVDLLIRHRGNLKAEWASARFIGVAPIGKPFRFSGGDNWVDVIVEEVLY